MSFGSWLRCEVEAGMLPNEFAVTIQTSTGKVSLFAPAEKVSRGAGLLAVELIDENATYGLVRLPRVPMDGPQVVKVDKIAVFLSKGAAQVTI